MNKKYTSKILAVGIILLFIGVSVSSAVSIDIKSTKVDNVEDCGCKEVSNSDLLKVEKLLGRVEVYSKLLLVLSKYNRKIKEKIEELFNKITILKEEFSNDRFPIICGILENITLSLWGILVPIWDWMIWVESEPLTLLKIIVGLCCSWIGNICTAILGPVLFTAFLLQCDFFHFYP